MHPWITRNFNDKIPLTRTEEMSQYNVHDMLSKIVKLATFMQIVKQFNEVAPNPNKGPLNLSDSHFYPSPKKNLGMSYMKKIRQEVSQTDLLANFKDEDFTN